MTEYSFDDARADLLALDDDMRQAVLAALSLEEREALVMSPPGTLGLLLLGIDDADHADLENLGPVAQAEARERWAEVREWMAREKLSGLTSDIAALEGPARDRLIEGLLAALGATRGG